MFTSIKLKRKTNTESLFHFFRYGSIAVNMKSFEAISILLNKISCKKKVDL